MTATSPLFWPAGQQRTTKRHPASFQMTGAKAYEHLVAEVQRLGGKMLNVTSNLPVTKLGRPHFGAGKAALQDPGVAVYFERKGVDVCISCDRWTTVDDNIRAIGLTIEALRGVERWGSQEMLDAAFRGFAALPAPAGPDWWTVLEVELGASRAEIDAAYRAQLKRHHPDVGGTPEQFHAVQEAYQAATSLS
jgi:hypothetical protein